MSEPTNTTQTPAPSNGTAAAQGTPPGNTQPSAPQSAEAPGGDLLDTAAAGEAQHSTAGDVLAGADDTKPEGVPDQYTFEPPEGLDPKLLDEVKLEAFKEKAKEYGLTQSQFQRLIEYDFERTQAAVQEAVDAWQQRVEGWKQAARTDKDFGGENYDANVRTALAAVEKFADAEFKALLRSPSEQNPEGLAIGNHPAVLRFLNRIGKMLGDPSLVQGDAQAKDSTDEARLRRLYPSMFKESA